MKGTKQTKKSTGYAVIDLADAIERAKKIYKAETKNPADVSVLVRHIGYGGKSGPAMAVLSSLNKYGLLEKVSPSNLKLSKRALTIILLGSDAPEAIDEIKQAALGPRIHRQIWDKFHGFPSEANLKHYLIATIGYNHNAANDVIPVYKKTIEFAKLSENDIIPSEAESSLENGENEVKDTGVIKQDMIPQNNPQPIPRGIVTREFSYPLMGGLTASIKVPFPMSKENFTLLTSILTASEKGFTTPLDSDEKKEGAHKKS